MTRDRNAIAVAVVIVLALTGISTGKPSTPVLVYNASASVPLGFYAVEPVNRLERGDFVLVQTPEAVRDLADQRQYLPKTVPMIKVVAALNGDEVCGHGTNVWINRVTVANRMSVDALGRPLPTWEGCHRLRADEVFLLNRGVRTSFDGRYFGVVGTRLVLGKVRAL